MAFKNKEDKIKELTEKLEQGIKDVYESDQYKLYLQTMAKFHSYSFRNSLLIMLQRPDATYVAGFNAWKDKFNRHVNKGEKGIQILAPAPYKVKVEQEKLDPITQQPIVDNAGKTVTEEVEITKLKFRPTYVFDIRQTSGEPLSQFGKELTGDVAEYNSFFESLKGISPFPIQFEDIHGGARGYCDSINQKIAIKSRMSEIQNIKTAIHEIAHAALHVHGDIEKNRRVKEVEAESVAFVVCSHYGIDTSDYSFPYLANWSSNKELKELKGSLETIQQKAAELIDKIDVRFHELRPEIKATQAIGVNLLKQMRAAGYEPIYVEGFSDDFLMWKELSTGDTFGLDGKQGVQDFIKNKIFEATYENHYNYEEEEELEI